MIPVSWHITALYHEQAHLWLQNFSYLFLAVKDFRSMFTDQTLFQRLINKDQSKMSQDTMVFQVLNQVMLPDNMTVKSPFSRWSAIMGLPKQLRDNLLGYCFLVLSYNAKQLATWFLISTWHLKIIENLENNWKAFWMLQKYSYIRPEMK